MPLATGVLTRTYTALNLTPGLTYKFKVQSRNAVGLSDFAPEVSILAAKVPDAPKNLANVVA